MGVGSYIEFVVKIESPGDYQLTAVISAQGPCRLSTAAVVNDAKQADAGYPMKELLRTEKSNAAAFTPVSAGTVTFRQAGFHLLRFSSQVKKQLLQIDRIQLKN
jgi:hypothetical protein